MRIDAIVKTSIDEAATRLGIKNLYPLQRQAIEANIEGKPTLVIFPTGGGKSACFYIPELVCCKHEPLRSGGTLVISPLIALMTQQVAFLRSKGIQAYAFHHQVSDSNKNAARVFFAKPVKPGTPFFLFVTPEFLQTKEFHERFARHFHRVAVDEAHCVSTWGSTFRFEYMQIAPALKKYNLHWSAYTATTCPRVERDLSERLPLGPNGVRVFANPLRPNLKLSIERMSPYLCDDSVARQKVQHIKKIAADERWMGPMIVYCSTVGSVFAAHYRFTMERKFQEQYGYTFYQFYAAMPADEKQQVIDVMSNSRDRRLMVFATSALGMGMDWPDVRSIVHYSLPWTLIDYAQQIGRAGRDGKDSLCMTLLSVTDAFLQDKSRPYSLESVNIAYKTVERVYGMLCGMHGRLTPEGQKTFTLQKFLKQIDHLVHKKSDIRMPDRYLAVLETAVSLLERGHVIRQSEQGLVIRDLVQGSALQQRLLELTEYERQMRARESARMNQFFRMSNPTQQDLWKILQTA